MHFMITVLLFAHFKIFFPLDQPQVIIHTGLVSGNGVWGWKSNTKATDRDYVDEDEWKFCRQMSSDCAELSFIATHHSGSPTGFSYLISSLIVNLGQNGISFHGLYAVSIAAWTE